MAKKKAEKEGSPFHAPGGKGEIEDLGLLDYLYGEGACVID